MMPDAQIPPVYGYVVVGNHDIVVGHGERLITRPAVKINERGAISNDMVIHLGNIHKVLSLDGRPFFTGETGHLDGTLYGRPFIPVFCCNVIVD